LKNIESEKKNLIKIMHGIAKQFGNGCEVVLHDFGRDHDHTILAIENGQVTNRRADGPITSHGLEVMRGTKPATDEYNYINQTQNGKLLRSSSIYLNDDDGKVVGSLCINLDITNLIATRNMLDNLIYVQGESAPQQMDTAEIVTNDVNEMLDILIQKSIRYVGVPVATMTREDKMKGLQYLDERGAFLIKKSSDRIAQSYDISRFSLYNYLDTVRNPDNGEKTGRATP